MKGYSKFIRLTGLLILALINIGSEIVLAQDWNRILANPVRPQNEQALDASRKPGEVLKFYGVKPGDRVADLMTGGGYYATILSLLVGEKGVVYAASSKTSKELTERFHNPALANVKLIEGPMESVGLPADNSLDFVIIHLNYHDLPPDVRIAMNRRVLAALKPGGTYGVVDHAAKDGSGNEVAKTLHRIDKALVIKEVTGSGFILARESDLLRDPSDSRTETVFRVRGKTDRFVLGFQKPR